MRRILNDTLLVTNFPSNSKATVAMAPTATCNRTSCRESAHRTGSFNPALAVVVSAVVICFFVVGFASRFLRRWIWGSDDEVRYSELMRRRRLLSRRALRAQAALKPPRGLDPEVVAALPVVLHKDLPVDEQAGKHLDCVVCLAAFEASDRLKLLPECNHAFHSECIDEWLLFHSTCPICRVSLAPPVGKSSTTSDAPFSDDDVNSSGIDLSADSAVVGHDAQEIPALSTASTAGDEDQVVQVVPHPTICSTTSQRFSSSVPTIRVDTAPARAELASIRRSSSVGNDLQVRSHPDYVFDSEGTQHQNSLVHVIDIDGRSGSGSPASGLPCVWCTRRFSFPNLRQVGPVWKSSQEGAGSGHS